MEHVWLVSGITAAATKEGCETGTYQDTSKDFFFSPWSTQGRKCTRKRVLSGCRALFVGLDRKKKAFAVGGGFGEPLWRGRSRGLFSGMLVVPQAIQTPQLSTGLPALVDAADGCIRRAREGPARAVLRDAVQNAECRMQDAKCEESRGFRKGRKKGRAGPHPGSTECRYRYRYRYGHHSGLLRPGGILGCQPVWHRSAPALAGASQRQATTGLVIAGSATCVYDRDPVRVQKCPVQAGTSANAIRIKPQVSGANGVAAAFAFSGFSAASLAVAFFKCLQA